LVWRKKEEDFFADLSEGRKEGRKEGGLCDEDFFFERKTTKN